MANDSDSELPTGLLIAGVFIALAVVFLSVGGFHCIISVGVCNSAIYKFCVYGGLLATGLAWLTIVSTWGAMRYRGGADG